METIKNYLEGMFASLPNTPEVLKAKRELSQMMEDKYNELISEGKSDNEAVGVVISEFGNLDELAEDLGIKTFTEEYPAEDLQVLVKEDATNFINAVRNQSVVLGLGIMFCIISVIGPIIFTELGLPDSFSACSMFLIIAIGVITIVYSSVKSKSAYKIFEVPSRLDYSTDIFVKEEREKYTTTHALRLTAGIILCALCWFPCVISDDFIHSSSINSENVGAALLFLLVGIGVFLIVQTNVENGAYEKLLNLDGTAKQVREAKRKDIPEYSNTTIDIVMHVFWPTMTCIYLVWSFLTFKWHITWIVWPIAGVVFGALKTVFRHYEK